MNAVTPTATDVGIRQEGGLSNLSSVDFANSIDLAVYDRVESIKEEWLAAELNSSISVYQRYEWIKSYIKSGQCGAEAQPFIVMGKLEGEVVFILPFSIHGKLLKRIQFIGGAHVNFNLGIFTKKFSCSMTPKTMRAIFKRVLNLTPGMGYAKLCCQPESWRGVTNPLLALIKQPSANPAFVLDLKESFQETIAQGNAKRKRKKFRSQERQAEKLGGYEFIKGEDFETNKAILKAFFQQKSYRLKSQGIRDVFSDECVHDFLISLTKNASNDEPLLRLYALKVGEDIAAVFGAGELQGRISGYFSSIDIQKYAQLSPGEMLLYLIVEDCCKQGFEQIDLGAGEERYKKSWCTNTIDMFDVILPLSFISHPIVTTLRVYADIRRLARENKYTWNFYKRIRKLRGSIN